MGSGSRRRWSAEGSTGGSGERFSWPESHRPDHLTANATEPDAALPVGFPDPEVLDDAGNVVGEAGVFGVVEVVEAVPPQPRVVGLAAMPNLGMPRPTALADSARITSTAKRFELGCRLLPFSLVDGQVLEVNGIV
jgi:hypothetical protein